MASEITKMHASLHVTVSSMTYLARLVKRVHLLKLQRIHA